MAPQVVDITRTPLPLNHPPPQQVGAAATTTQPLAVQIPPSQAPASKPLLMGSSSASTLSFSHAPLTGLGSQGIQGPGTFSQLQPLGVTSVAQSVTPSLTAQAPSGGQPNAHTAQSSFLGLSSLVPPAPSASSTGLSGSPQVGGVFHLPGLSSLSSSAAQPSATVQPALSTSTPTSAASLASTPLWKTGNTLSLQSAGSIPSSLASHNTAPSQSIPPGQLPQSTPVSSAPSSTQTLGSTPLWKLGSTSSATALNSGGPLTQTLGSGGPFTQSFGSGGPFTQSFGNGGPLIQTLGSGLASRNTAPSQSIPPGQPTLSTSVSSAPTSTQILGSTTLWKLAGTSSTTALDSGGPLTHTLGSGGPLTQTLGSGGPLTQTLGSGGPLTQTLGSGGPLTQTLGSGGPLTQTLGSGGPFTQTLGSGGPLTQTLGSGGPLTQTLGSGGPLTQTLGSGGPLTQTLGSGGPFTQTLGSGGPLTQTLGSGGPIAQTLGSGGPLTQTHGSGGFSTSAASLASTPLWKTGNTGPSQSIPPGQPPRSTPVSSTPSSTQTLGSTPLWKLGSTSSATALNSGGPLTASSTTTVHSSMSGNALGSIPLASLGKLRSASSPGSATAVVTTSQPVQASQSPISALTNLGVISQPPLSSLERVDVPRPLTSTPIGSSGGPLGPATTAPGPMPPPLLPQSTAWMKPPDLPPTHTGPALGQLRPSAASSAPSTSKTAPASVHAEALLPTVQSRQTLDDKYSEEVKKLVETFADSLNDIRERAEAILGGGCFDGGEEQNVPAIGTAKERLELTQDLNEVLSQINEMKDNFKVCVYMHVCVCVCTRVCVHVHVHVRVYTYILVM